MQKDWAIPFKYILNSFLSTCLQVHLGKQHFTAGDTGLNKALILQVLKRKEKPSTKTKTQFHF